jgi:nucleoside-diphosphate-sugar epimerase
MLDSTFGDALPAHVTVFASAPRPLTLRSGRTLTPQYFGQLEHVRTRPSLIFHFAFLTRGHAQTPNFVATNRGISRTLRGFIERNGARGLFIPSSGAVYGPARVLESDMDRNPYGVLKHEDELVFGALAARLGFPAAIMRIFNLGGAFINNLSGYALACIIADVLRGTSVTLRAAQPVWRSYTHVEDVLNIATAILLRQLALPVFDTAGEPEIEVGDLAARVGRLLTEGEVSIIRPDWQNGAANRYLGDLAAYRDAAALAGVKLQSLDQQILDTANYIAHVARSR